MSSKRLEEKTVLDDGVKEEVDECGDSGFISGPISELLSSGSVDYFTQKSESECIDSGISGTLSNSASSNRNNFEESDVKQTNVPVNINLRNVQQANTLPWQYLFQQDADGDTQLHIAALRGCEASIRTLLQSCPNPELLNTCNSYGHTALHLAVLAGHAIVVRMLVLQGANIGIRDFCGETPVHVAAACDDCSCLQALLEPVPKLPRRQISGIIDQRNYNGQSAVHLATTDRYKNVLKTLVCYGANINSREGLSGHTPLHLAVINHDVEMASFILDHFHKHLELGVDNYGKKTARQMARNTVCQELFQRVPLQEGEEFDSDYSDEDDELDTDSGDEMSVYNALLLHTINNGKNPINVS